MKKAKLFLAVVLILSMCFGMAAGCSKTETKSESGVTPAAEKVEGEKTTASTEVIELKLGHPLVPASSQHRYLEKWAGLVEGKSDGKYKITVYPSAQFGEARELVESLNLGVYDLAWCDTGVMDFIVPEMSLMYMPFFIQSYDELEKLVDGPVGEKLTQICIDKANIHPLSFYWLGSRHIFTRESVKNLEDLKNIKVRVPELPLWIKTFSTLGMNPSPVAWSELYTALESHLVDAGCANYENICVQQIYKITPYIWQSSHFYQTGVPSFNETFWKSLSDEDQKMFAETAKEIALEQRATAEAEDETYIQKMKADGATFLPLKDFEDLDVVLKKYQDGLWKEIVEDADAQDLYELMKSELGR